MYNTKGNTEVLPQKMQARMNSVVLQIKRSYELCVTDVVKMLMKLFDAKFDSG